MGHCRDEDEIEEKSDTSIMGFALRPGDGALPAYASGASLEATVNGAGMTEWSCVAMPSAIGEIEAIGGNQRLLRDRVRRTEIYVACGPAICHLQHAGIFSCIEVEI